MSKKFYLTTTLPYVNADPHIGFALEIVQADAIARYHKLLGNEVIFNFGTDEHGLKIYRKAREQGKNPQDYCDEYAQKWSKLKDALNLSYTNFIRTTDKRHIKAAEEFWKRCLKNGDIYEKEYETKYCVGCELEKSDSELENGRCPLHPNLELEIFKEDNYFFRFTNYQNKLLKFYEAHPKFVIPETKFNEIKTFVKDGLQDFSISRVKSKMPWGVDVPDNKEQVMYVWFEALTSYISTLGWPDSPEFSEWWGTKEQTNAVQVAGKDNLRQQTAIWQAMLMSAGLPNSKQVFIHGFVTTEGQKISKSLGNVVDPFALVKKHGTDAVRYYLLREIPSYSDGDFSERRFKELYNADLANGLGNLVARVAKLLEIHKPLYEDEKINDFSPYINYAIENFKFDEGLNAVWIHIKNLDRLLDEWKPWSDSGIRASVRWNELVRGIRQIAFDLQPFLPQTAEKIQKQFAGPHITSGPPLFPRLV
ncbi:MAG: methionine--tRNA ligase [bacterium]|nr:methionine--tRNA ligase [bacterium]